MARSEGGLGIGLALVKRFVEAHGGRVSARSDGPGSGAEFVVTLPAASAPGAPRAQESVSEPIADLPVPARPVRILVVDDNRDAADLVATILRAAGHDVAVAYSGADAVAAADGPDVVVLDIGLPDFDGYTIASEILGRGAGGSPALIALSGYGQAHDRSRSLASGFAAHLVKPVDAERLLAAIDDALAGRAAR